MPEFFHPGCRNPVLTVSALRGFGLMFPASGRRSLTSKRKVHHRYRHRSNGCDRLCTVGRFRGKQNEPKPKLPRPSSEPTRREPSETSRLKLSPNCRQVRSNSMQLIENSDPSAGLESGHTTPNGSLPEVLSRTNTAWQM